MACFQLELIKQYLNVSERKIPNGAGNTSRRRRRTDRLSHRTRTDSPRGCCIAVFVYAVHGILLCHRRVAKRQRCSRMTLPCALSFPPRTTPSSSRRLALVLRRWSIGRRGDLMSVLPSARTGYQTARHEHPASGSAWTHRSAKFARLYGQLSAIYPSVPSLSARSWRDLRRLVEREQTCRWSSRTARWRQSSAFHGSLPPSRMHQRCRRAACTARGCARRSLCVHPKRGEDASVAVSHVVCYGPLEWP